MLIDPLGAAVKAIFAYRDEQKKERWARLIISIAFSNMIAFLFVTGSTLLTVHSWTIAIGSAFIVCSAITIHLLLTDPQGRELTLVLNTDSTKNYQKELGDGFTEIQPKK